MDAKRLGESVFSCFARGVEMLTHVTGYAGTLAVFFSMVIITYEVLSRYVFRWATVWEIEAAVYLVIFTTFVGSAFALKNDAHIRMDMLTNRLRPGVRKKLSIFTSLLSLAFCVIASLKGIAMWWEAYYLGWRSDSLWAPPLAIPYAFLPIGFISLSLQYMVDLIREFRSLR